MISVMRWTAVQDSLVASIAKTTNLNVAITFVSTKMICATTMMTVVMDLTKPMRFAKISLAMKSISSDVATTNASLDTMFAMAKIIAVTVQMKTI